jgi:hypothetical protein
MANPGFLRLLVAALAAIDLLAASSAGLADNNAQREEFYRLVQQYHDQQSVPTPQPAPTTQAVAPAQDLPPPPSGGQTALLVTGVIGPGSYDEFHAAIARATPEIVVIDGPGGVLGEAILIGEEIRRLGIDTLVAPHHSCASACAVVFLSGHTRYLGSGASVGLHSASFADGRADPEATALMAAYLSQVGVPSSTLHLMEMTAPRDIRWLTASEQKAIGIRRFKEGQ